jgi:hypothetical protein
LMAGRPDMMVDTKTTKGEAYQKQVYDLTNDMVFVDADEVEYSLEELIDETRARKELKQPGLRLTGSFTGDTASSGSPRCKVHWSTRNGLSIVDFKTGTTHRPYVKEDDNELNRLFANILPKFTSSPPSGGEDDDDAVLERLAKEMFPKGIR